MSEPQKIGSIIRERYACDHGDAVLSRVVLADGSFRITLWCRDCKTHVAKEKGYPGIWISHADPSLPAVPLDQLPIAYADFEFRKCQRCGTLTRCELHHWAPRAHGYFGPDEADAWPMGWLCRPCHERWHTIVTPGLCTTFNPDATAAQLLEVLGVERAAHLTRSLIKLGRERRPQNEAAD